MTTIYGRYYNSRNGWTYEIVAYSDTVVEIRSSGMPYYFMTMDGAIRMAARFERLKG